MAVRVLEKRGDIRLVHYEKCKYHNGFYSVERTNKDVGMTLKASDSKQKAKTYFDKVIAKETSRKKACKKTNKEKKS